MVASAVRARSVRRRRGGLGSIVLAACACSSSPVTPVAPPATRSVELCLITSPKLNGGGVLHVVARKTSAIDFEKVSYEEIVATLSQPDPETLQWFQLLPGQSNTLSLQLASGRSAATFDDGVGIYFLFADRGEPWKAWIDPSVPHVSFILGRSRIEVDDRKRWKCHQ